MKKLILRTVLISACLLVFVFASYAQKTSANVRADNDSAGIAVAKGAGKATVIVVGSAAKVAWKTTKFTSRHVAKPIFLKATPAAGKYIVKKSAKYLLPFATKLSLL